MSKRLQVLLDEEEWRDLREVADRKGLTVSEWVRRTLREAGRAEPEGDLAHKLEVIHTAARYEFPAPDIDQMLEGIERGYPKDLPEDLPE